MCAKIELRWACRPSNTICKRIWSCYFFLFFFVSIIPPLWSASGKYEPQHGTGVSELSWGQSQSWRGTRSRVLWGTRSRHWPPSGRRSWRSPRTAGLTACSSCPCHPATCRPGARGQSSPDTSSGYRTQTPSRKVGLCAQKIRWLQKKKCFWRYLHINPTVKGVPLVGVKTQWHLGDGHEVILLHLPLQTGLLSKQMMNTETLFSSGKKLNTKSMQHR